MTSAVALDGRDLTGSKVPARNDWIDIIRGYALITITINHASYFFQLVGYRQAIIPTVTKLGFSSAAELFIFLSGYMVGLVYLRKPNAASRIGHRLKQLYLTNMAVLVSVAIIALATPDLLNAATGMQHFLAHPILGLAGFATLTYAPLLLGVLQMYLVFMSVAAVLARWIIRYPLLTIGLSTATYLTVQAIPSINLPGGFPSGDWRWELNPFAFQVLFFVGVVSGTRLMHRAVFWVFERHTTLCVAALALFVLVSVAYVGNLHGLTGHAVFGKNQLGLLRLLHFPIVLAFLIAALSLTRRWHSHAGFRLVALLGRHTLYGFAVGIVATYAAVAVWISVNGGRAGYLAISISILFAVSLTAWLLDKRKHRTSKTFNR